jgi:hypothetical protein
MKPALPAFNHCRDYAARVLALLFFLMLARHGFGQQALTLSEQRLCRTWKFDHIEQENRVITADKSLSDFVIIITGDHRISQGMYPEGLIRGTWTLREKDMVLLILDETTSQQYEMKIISLTTDALILQDPQAPSSVVIHYRAEK